MYIRETSYDLTLQMVAFMDKMHLVDYLNRFIQTFINAL